MGGVRWDHQRQEHAASITAQLLNYCKSRNWAGHDPYDALNSRLVAGLLFFKFARIAATQTLKRLPINVRPFLLIPRKQNAKALSLFLRAAIRLAKCKIIEPNGMAESMVDRIENLRSPGVPYYCWGYSFPWQTRTFLVPRDAPNLVSTCFVAEALLEAYEANLGEKCLAMAISAADYLIDDLFWTSGWEGAGFSYPVPKIHSNIHNANLLGSALLSKVYRYTGERKYLNHALTVARYSVKRQNEDGSWFYGEHPVQHWIDNFHTGYILSALQAIDQRIESSEFDNNLRCGYTFFRQNFFLTDGTPKYYHDRTYPIDIHSVAQSIITLVNMSDLDQGGVDKAREVFSWAMINMWDEKGFFYFQKHPHFTIKIPYMRWSQAWMLWALSNLLDVCGTDARQGEKDTGSSGLTE